MYGSIWISISRGRTAPDTGRHALYAREDSVYHYVVDLMASLTGSGIPNLDYAVNSVLNLYTKNPLWLWEGKDQDFWVVLAAQFAGGSAGFHLEASVESALEDFDVESCKQLALMLSGKAKEALSLPNEMASRLLAGVYLSAAARIDAGLESVYGDMRAAMDLADIYGDIVGSKGDYHKQMVRCVHRGCAPAVILVIPGQAADRAMRGHSQYDGHGLPDGVPALKALPSNFFEKERRIADVKSMDKVVRRQAAQKAVAQGHTVAMFNLGWMYAMGNGVPQDIDRGVKLFRELLDKGDFRGKFSIGRCLVEGIGMGMDKEAGFKLIREAAPKYERARKYLEKHDPDSPENS